MALNNVIVGEAVTDTLMNQIIAHVNTSPTRIVLTSNTNWQVPAGVFKLKVTICGGGGGGGVGTTTSDGENMSPADGAPGGVAPMISAVLSGFDTGTTFVVNVGAGGAGGVYNVNSGTGGTGGTTSFGPNFSSSGGLGGPGSGGIAGHGNATFPSGAPPIYHPNQSFSYGWDGNNLVGYGTGGKGGFGYPDPGQVGRNGVVIIEW